MNDGSISGDDENERLYTNNFPSLFSRLITVIRVPESKLPRNRPWALQASSLRACPWAPDGISDDDQQGFDFPFLTVTLTYGAFVTGQNAIASGSP
jgi:hypothetical protein